MPPALLLQRQSFSPSSDFTSAAQSITSSAMAIDLGLGLGLGIPAILAVCGIAYFLIRRHNKKQATAAAVVVGGDSKEKAAAVEGGSTTSGDQGQSRTGLLQQDLTGSSYQGQTGLLQQGVGEYGELGGSGYQGQTGMMQQGGGYGELGGRGLYEVDLAHGHHEMSGLTRHPPAQPGQGQAYRQELMA